MIRFITIAVILGLYLLLGIPVLGIEWLIGKFSKTTEDYQCLWLVQGAFKLMLKVAGTDITVIGEENIPDEPVVFIGNHRSYFDILLTYSRCKRLTGYIAKKEMLRYPLLRTWMKRLYCLFLDRENPREGLKTILQAIEYMKNGVSICIFPEGTRNDGEECSILPFHSGSFKIAEKSGCAIIPMCINNSAEIFENHLPKIRKASVVIEYGKPIYMKDMTPDERKKIAGYCQNIIQETINKNKEIIKR